MSSEAPSWSIRPVRREDCVEIWRLIEELAHFERLSQYLEGSAPQVERWLFDEPVASALVAEAAGQIVGYALYFPTLATFKMRPGFWLEDLFVDLDYRGTGIGKALINEVIAIAKQKGYARVDWTVLDWNENAIAFYRSLGAELLDDWRVCRFHL